MLLRHTKLKSVVVDGLNQYANGDDASPTTSPAMEGPLHAIQVAVAAPTPAKSKPVAAFETPFKVAPS